MARGSLVLEVALCAIALTTWTAATIDRNPVLQLPTTSLPLSLGLAGFILGAASWLYPKSITSSKEYAAIPLDDLGEAVSRSSLDNSIARDETSLLKSPPSARRRFLMLIACLVLRICLLGTISMRYECSQKGVEAMLPILLAIYDSAFPQSAGAITDDEDDDTMGNSIFDDWRDAWSKSRLRYLLPIILICAAAYWSSILTISTTVICLHKSSSHLTVTLQCVGAILDAALAVGTWNTLLPMSERKRLQTIGSLLASAAVIAMVLGSFTTLLLSTPGLGFGFAWSWQDLYPSLWDGIITAAVLGCLCHVLPELPPLTFAVLLVFSYTFTALLGQSFTTQLAFPPPYHLVKILSIVFSFVGLSTYMHLTTISEPQLPVSFSRRIPWLFYGVSVVVIIIATIIQMLGHTAVGYHPIGVMMYNGRINHDRWLTQAASSGSLAVAVKEYRSRYYDRSPPPHFDKWYEFAIVRKSVIIDDYDQITNDLLPFWAIEPRDLRRRTRSLIENSNGDIIGIRVRGSEVEVLTELGEDSRWFADAVISMIKAFAEWLPDVEFAINLRSEPRSPVDWNELQRLREEGVRVKTELDPDGNVGFSVSHAGSDDGTLDSSPPGDQKLLRKSRFDHVMAGCPAASQVRRGRNWNTRDLCTKCVYPHSLGQFVLNWTIATDICHQPDMSYFHGDFSPRDASFGETKTLSPLFSRSKISGYNDILFPWPGDYRQSGATPPAAGDWEHLIDSLYWRGDATASKQGFWKGNQQCRLNTLIHNFTSSTFIPMLLPAKEENRFTYENVKLAELSDQLEFNVAIDAERSNDISLAGMPSEQSLAEHYKHRYLLAMDAHGPSSNFLAFLRSKSLPFRASIYREWFDGRLSEWLHFVPQDLRFQGMHSTLAYFTGFKGVVKGQPVEISERSSDAEFIAEQGRRWAEKSLRKEDMEIYMFRLLLEWARLVDDRRNSIGFGL